MAIPAPPVLGFSFTAFSTNNPLGQQPGVNLDAEFNRTNGAVGQLINSVTVSVNADGTLNTTQVANALNALNLALGNNTLAALQNTVTNNNTTLTNAAAAAQTTANLGVTNAAAAQTTANTGVTNAATAQTTANAAQTTATAAQSAALDAPFRNQILNGQFTVQQRGAGPWTTAGYTADRWAVIQTNGTRSYSLVALADADRTAIGDEEASVALQANVTGGTGANDIEYFAQNLENLRKYSNKTVTVSFWARATAGANVKLGVRLNANFGTGGAPSAIVATAGQLVALTAAWAFYTLTFAVPSAAGKTFGTNGDSSLGVVFALSAGATISPGYGGVPAQTATFQFWGLQAENAALASALEKRPYQTELAMCQRHYQTGEVYLIANAPAATPVAAGTMTPVSFRASPTLTIVTNYSGNCSSVAAAYAAGMVYLSGTVTAAGNFTLAATYSASADL